MTAERDTARAGKQDTTNTNEEQQYLITDNETFDKEQQKTVNNKNKNQRVSIDLKQIRKNQHSSTENVLSSDDQSYQYRTKSI